MVPGIRGVTWLLFGNILELDKSRLFLLSVKIVIGPNGECWQ